LKEEKKNQAIHKTIQRLWQSESIIIFWQWWYD